MGGINKIVTDRVSLPERGAYFDLAAHLIGDVKKAYEDPTFLDEETASVAPTAKVHADRDEWQKFLRRVDAAGQLRFVHPDDVPRDANGCEIRNGMFAIRKDADTDRVITNRIPQNSQERSLGLVGDLLPHGANFVDLQLGPHAESILVIHGDDMPDCFHACSVSADRSRRNVVGDNVSLAAFDGGEAANRFRAGLGKFEEPPREVVPAFGSLVMGDLNAVDFVQAGHTNLLRKYGLMQQRDTVRYRGNPPRGSLWEGIVVDDHIVAEVCDRTQYQAGFTTLAQRVQDASRVAYKDHGIVPKEKKAIVNQTSARFWGAEVDGDYGDVRASMPLILKTLMLSLWTLQVGAITAGAWSSLIGLWTYILLYRRDALCVLSASYAASLGLADNDVIVPATGARAELSVLAVLSPLLASNMRATVAEAVYATDASQTLAAAVVTELPKEAACELWRHRSRKGHRADIRSMGPDIPEIDDCCSETDRVILRLAGEIRGEDSHIAPASSDVKWVDELVQDCQFKPVFCYPLPAGEHINIKELRAVRTLVRFLARNPKMHALRQVVLLDSAVVLGALAKGRSRSRRINRLLRSMLPDMLFCDIYLGCLHVSTKYNVADDPTRHRPVRAARRALSAVSRALFAKD